MQIGAPDSGAHAYPDPGAVSGTEVASVTVLLLALLAVNLATAPFYPVAWLDEVMFTDPAAHLASGAGFHTTAWPNHDRTSFFAGYPPLYSAVLALWIKMTGLSPTGVRSLNHVLITLVGLGVWFAVVRSRLVAGGPYRVLLVALVVLGYGMSLGYRTGRPDTIMALLVVALFFVFTVQAATWRYAGLSIVGGLLPFAGIQLLPYAAITLVLLFLFLGRRYVKELLCIGFGAGVGVALLVGLYAANGVLGNFLAAMGNHTETGLLGALLGRGTFHHENTIPKDLSLIVLLPAGLVLAWHELRSKRNEWRSALLFAVAAVVAVPTAMIASGKFPTYYAWMVYIPLAVGVASSLSAAPRAGPAGWTALALAIAACAVGLPFQLAYAAYDRQDRDHDRVMSTFSPLVESGQWVYCDYGAYYAARSRTADVISPNFLKQMPEADRRQVSVMIVDPANAGEVQSALGGNWRKVGAAMMPTRRMLVEDLTGITVNFGIFDRKYRLQAYRREPGA